MCIQYINYERLTFGQEGFQVIIGVNITTLVVVCTFGLWSCPMCWTQLCFNIWISPLVQVILNSESCLEIKMLIISLHFNIFFQFILSYYVKFYFLFFLLLYEAYVLSAVESIRSS